MWATVGAALKKIAVALLGNPKVLKTIGGIVLGLIIIIVMPVVAIVSIFNGDIEIDTNELQRMVVENLSAEEQAKLQFVEDTMYAIEREMKASGFSDPRVTEAQVLFTLSLYDYAQEADFVSKLVGCFASEQTDEQLIAAVNAAFGTAISAEEFSQVMGAIRSVYIDTSGYIDPCTKNNLDLVEWAKQAKLRGWGYVWGTYGEVLTRSYYNAKAEQYPDEVGGYADFIESNWLGGRTSDCNGLIKGYGWLNPDTHEIEYGTNGMPDIGADTMYANATEKGTIDTIPEIPGLAVWHEGHIGIYIGGGKVIEAMGTKYGVVETELAGRGWTHWLKVPYITYLDTEMSSSANEKHIWDTLYAKIGNPYGVAGLMGNLYAESALRPDNLQGSFEDALGHSDASYTQAVDSGAYTGFATDSAGYGLAQWTASDRKESLLAYAKEQGKSIGDLDMQLDFLYHELETKFPDVLAQLKNATSVRAASDSVLLHFEMPKDQSASVQAERALFGSTYYERYRQAKLLAGAKAKQQEGKYVQFDNKPKKPGLMGKGVALFACEKISQRRGQDVR